PPVKVAELANRRVGVMTQVQHLLRKVEKDPPRGGQRAVLGRAVEERLAPFCFQATNRLANLRLRGMKRIGGPGRALFLGPRQENFQLVYIHANPCLKLWRMLSRLMLSHNIIFS